MTEPGEQRVDQGDRASPRGRLVRGAAGFLAVSYGVAAPVTAWIEFRGHVLSERFDYAPQFIYLVCAVQVVCAIGVLVRSLAPWAAGVLTVITLGAIVSHLRVGSPLSAAPALIYTAVQVWFGLARRAANERT